MAPRCLRLTGLAVAFLFAASTPLLAQDEDEHSVHHPEPEAAEAPPPAASEGSPPAGLMGQGMMGPGMMEPGEGERESMPEGMMPRGMMGPDMMHGMMESVMRGSAEGLARGLVEGMVAVHEMEPEMGPAMGMRPRGMRQHGMMRSRGVGPTLVYGPPGPSVLIRVSSGSVGGARRAIDRRRGSAWSASTVPVLPRVNAVPVGPDSIARTASRWPTWTTCCSTRTLPLSGRAQSPTSALGLWRKVQRRRRRSEILAVVDRLAPGT
jgi:hypothetical protein